MNISEFFSICRLCVFRNCSQNLSLRSLLPSPSCCALSGKKKAYTTTVETLPFFLFQGLRLYGVYPSFRTDGVYPSFRTDGVYPFPFFSQENCVHHSFFCSVTSESGDRPRKEGCHGGSRASSSEPPPPPSTFYKRPAPRPFAWTPPPSPPPRNRKNKKISETST